MLDLLSQWYVQVLLVLMLPLLVAFLVYRLVTLSRRQTPRYPQQPFYEYNRCTTCGLVLPPRTKYCFRCGRPTNWWRMGMG